jgi:small-conductance mechanosensitive channel
MDDRWLTAVITACAGVALVTLVRFAMGKAVRRYLLAIEARRGAGDAASMRTRLTILERATVVLLALIVVWQVLTVFPETDRVGNAVLASGVLLAAVFGLALSVPLGNLGAGILLAFTQPVRIGDRVTVGEATGTAEQITLIHTVLVTDDDRRVFIPNSQMVGSVVVNRSVVDPRRWVTVEIPVALGSPLEQAKAAVLGAVRDWSPELTVDIRIGSLTDAIAWLSLTAYAPPETNTLDLASELRERAVASLGATGLLPRT